MTDDTIIPRIEARGIDFERLDSALSSNDNWGDLAHSFEYLTVLEAVRDAWRERRENTDG